MVSMSALNGIADQFGGVFVCCRHLLHMHTALLLNSLRIYLALIHLFVCHAQCGEGGGMYVCMCVIVYVHVFDSRVCLCRPTE